MQSLGISMDNPKLHKEKTKSRSNSKSSSKNDKNSLYGYQTSGFSAKKRKEYKESLTNSLTPDSSISSSSSSSFEKDPNTSSEIACLVRAAFTARNKMERATRLDNS